MNRKLTRYLIGAIIGATLFILPSYVLKRTANNYFEARAECEDRCYPDYPVVDLLRSPVTGIQSCYCDERYRAP